MLIENYEGILIKRLAVEKALVALLQKAESKYTLEDIKSVIYNETQQNDMAKAIKMFDTHVQDIDINEIVALIVEAWNYFPHKLLNGLSPAEMALKYRR